MMMDMGSNGHFFWMLVPVAVLVLAAIFVGYQLAPASRSAVARLQSGPFLQPTAPSTHATEASTPEDLLIVIPDISGYTRFMSISKLGLAHAHYVIAELLTAVLDAGSRALQPMRLEGDAVVFYARVANMGPKDTANALLEIMKAFDARRHELVRENACMCEACRHIGDLDLKIIVHHGEVLRFRMGGMEDLSGEAIITAHRLLKNGAGQSRYILVTEGTLPYVDFSSALPERPIIETLDSAGTIAATLYEPPDCKLAESETENKQSTLSAKTADLGRKLRIAIRSQPSGSLQG